MVDGRTADKNEVGLLMATGGRERRAEGATGVTAGTTVRRDADDRRLTGATPGRSSPCR